MTLNNSKKVCPVCSSINDVYTKVCTTPSFVPGPDGSLKQQAIDQQSNRLSRWNIKRTLYGKLARLLQQKGMSTAIKRLSRDVTPILLGKTPGNELILFT